MGDRVSIQFQDSDGDKSPVLFHHWGGMYLPKFTSNWIRDFRKKLNTEDNVSDPLTRLEARSVAVQFIADLRNHEFFHECMGFEKDEEGKSIYQKPIHSSEFVSHSVYLGADENEGDNSDNGHFVIDTDTGDFVI